jgi:hypothetical protein
MDGTLYGGEHAAADKKGTSSPRHMPRENAKGAPKKWNSTPP